MNEVKKGSGMCSDFCAKWSDEECRLFLDKLKERKISYCEEHGIPVPLFDKVDDFLLTREMLFSVEPREMLQANENDWISVKDKLPEKTGNILCYVLIPDKGRAVKSTRIITYYTFDKSWSCEGMIVTHWMPLPPPPKDAN